MHICFLMPHHWSSSLGGAELQVRYLIQYIRQNSQHEVSMICCTTRITDDEGAIVYRSKPCLPFRRYSLVADYPSIRRHLMRLTPDVVYTRTCTPLVGFAAQYCQRRSIPFFYHIAHAEDVSSPENKGRRAFLKRIQRPIYDYGLRRANVIIAQAEYQAAALKQNYGLAATAIVANFHPIPDLSHARQKPYVVLWVANLKPSKRPEVFVDLARRFVHNKNARFIMVGEVQDAKCAHFLDNCNLPENLTYMGHQSIEEVNRLFSGSDVFVNTSRPDGEGFPNTFIQAWLHAVPVLSFEMDPDSLLTVHGIGDCCKGSLECLFKALQHLLSNDEYRTTVGQRAREYSVTNFSTKNCATLLQLLESYAPKAN